MYKSHGIKDLKVLVVDIGSDPKVWVENGLIPEIWNSPPKLSRLQMWTKGLKALLRQRNARSPSPKRKVARAKKPKKKRNGEKAEVGPKGKIGKDTEKKGRKSSKGKDKKKKSAPKSDYYIRDPIKKKAYKVEKGKKFKKGKKSGGRHGHASKEVVS